MTVKELLEKLQQCDPEQEVIILNEYDDDFPIDSNTFYLYDNEGDAFFYEEIIKQNH